jgi:hypothetical protein
VGLDTPIGRQHVRSVPRGHVGSTSEAVEIGDRNHYMKRLIMHRRAGAAFGAALAVVAGLSVAACGQNDAREASARAGSETSRTTQAMRPVVTVYKSPT